MAAASEIGSHTAYIHPSVGPKTHLELLNGRLIEENGHFHAGGVPQLAHDAVQILAGDTVEIQIFFPKGADDAFSIHQKHALQKGTAQDLVLKIGLLEKGLIQKLVEIKALLHELSGNFHRTPARAGILEHAGIMGNSHIKCFCCTDGKLRVIQQKIDKL